MSKESIHKKRQEAQSRPNPDGNNAGQPTKRYLTDEEKAWIIKERLARRPVIVWRYKNGKWNRRLIFMLTLMVIALGGALYFLTRYY
jgi:hypothetical protein